jgi:hypothetical protein
LLIIYSWFFLFLFVSPETIILGGKDDIIMFKRTKQKQKRNKQVVQKENN